MDDYLRVNVGQTVPAELVEEPPVLQVLHDHTDQLRVSRGKVGRPGVHVAASLRHDEPEQRFGSVWLGLVWFGLTPLTW